MLDLQMEEKAYKFKKLVSFWMYYEMNDVDINTTAELLAHEKDWVRRRAILAFEDQLRYLSDNKEYIEKVVQKLSQKLEDATSTDQATDISGIIETTKSFVYGANY